MDSDDEWYMVDATIVRAHQHAAGARGGQEKEEIGRSRGGLSTKIHLVVDALGNPIDYRLTAGQVHEMTQAVKLFEGKHSDYVIADGINLKITDLKNCYN